MNNSGVSAKETIDAAIQSYNPFINAGIVKEQDVWGEGFPDMPTLNAHASDAVFQAIEMVRTSQSAQEKVTSMSGRCFIPLATILSLKLFPYCPKYFSSINLNNSSYQSLG